MMSNPELLKMASDSMKTMKPEDLKRAAEQLKSTQPDQMADIGAKMANSTPEDFAAMRSQADAQTNYQLKAAQMLKQKVANCWYLEDLIGFPGIIIFELISWYFIIYRFIYNSLFPCWQGNELHSQGMFSEALEKYSRASASCNPNFFSFCF